MDKYEKLECLKEYIDKTEEDLNNSSDYDKDKLINRNILQCMKYISEILEDMALPDDKSEKQPDVNIQPENNRTDNSTRFFITNEQREQLTIMKNVIVSTMVSEINRVTQCNNTEKIIESWITDWLLDKGFLKLNSYYATVPSKAGRQLGITANSYDKFPRKYYTKKAQQFIYNNIDNIIAFHYGEN
ncbi:MAG: hypothetical protein K2F73_02850 [Ruminococcus sp.]|nr:hypothetical protein [Ruminococcus sp.]